MDDKQPIHKHQKVPDEGESSPIKVIYARITNRSYKIIYEFLPPMDKDGNILWNKIPEKDKRQNFLEANCTITVRPEWEQKQLDYHMRSWKSRGTKRKRKKK
jgi:hypothetical protein